MKFCGEINQVITYSIFSQDEFQSDWHRIDRLSAGLQVFHVHRFSCGSRSKYYNKHDPHSFLYFNLIRWNVVHDIKGIVAKKVCWTYWFTIQHVTTSHKILLLVFQTTKTKHRDDAISSRILTFSRLQVCIC